MAGQGLIWASVGQGIANSGSTVGSFLLRAQEREADRDYRDKLEQDRREYRAEQDALYKRTAAQQMEGRAGAGKDQGVQIEDLAPGGRAANMAANTLGYSEDDYNKFYKANKTGDLSEFARPIGKTLDDTYGVQTVTEVPQALKEEFALKRKELGRLQEVYALKKDYKEVMQGRQAGFEIDVGQGVLGGTIPLDKGAGAVGASQGKPVYDVKDGTAINQYTGKNEATAVGGSMITENLAKASEATAKAGGINFKTGVGQGVLAGTTPLGTGAGAVAASEGKPVYDVKDGTAINQYSGSNSATAVGGSMISENLAQAGEAAAKGTKATADAGLVNFKTGVGQGVLSGATKMGIGSGAVAAAEGKPIINIEGGEKYNQYLGESSTTPLGRSQIDENKAQAGQAGALARKYGKDIEKIDAEIKGGSLSDKSTEKLSTVINASNATIKSLIDNGKGSTKESQAAWQKSMDDAVAVRDQALALQRGALEAKKPPPAPAPVPKGVVPAGSLPEPKSAADLAKLKSGTRYKAPDGSIRTKG